LQTTPQYAAKPAQSVLPQTRRKGEGQVAQEAFSGHGIELKMS
jgi:hypothetical protein